MFIGQTLNLIISMKSKSRFSGNLINSKQHKQIEVYVDLIEYLEDAVYFVYSPALDLVGYGKTHGEARQSWETVLEEYVSYTMNKNTLIKDLQSRGWSVKGKKVKSPSLTWMLENNSDLSNVYNKHDFSKRRQPVSLPISA